MELKNISYSYADNTCALTRVSLDIAQGERVALLGNNGAGKSTLFLCCNGVLAPTDGSIRLNGKQLGGRVDLRQLRRSVGLVFQDPDDQMIAPTVESEVSFGPMNLHLGDDQVRARCDRALEEMNLTEYRHRPPHYLSGGEKKRVSIAGIVAMRPQLMLLDEPTASLDTEHTALLEQTLEQLHDGGLALMISTHDVDFAWRWADRGVVLSAGEVIADAPIAQIFAQQELMRRAGLAKPVLFELGQLLFPDMEADSLPRSVPVLKKMLEEQ